MSIVYVYFLETSNKLDINFVYIRKKYTPLGLYTK